MKRNELGRYEYENMKNKLSANAYRGSYTPAPTAPKLEVTINQNCSDTASNYSASRSPIRPPLGPPPLPPSEYAEPMVRSAVWLDKFPRKENKGMFRLALVEAMLAVIILGGGIWCYCDTPDYCPYYSAIWTSLVYLLNALLGSAAAKFGSINLYVAHLVLSLIAVMMCAVSGGISARNWALVGTYVHPTLNRNKAFCLFGEHDATRLSYVFTHMDQYDFRKCLFELKVGIAVNSVQFVIAGVEAFLNLISAFLCCKRTCTTCR